jgi:outer membrane protein assembly factor BamB
MKFIVNIFLGILMSLNLLSCKSDDCPPEPVGETSPIVWKKAFNKTDLTSTIHWYKGTIIVGHPSDVVNNYIVYCINPLNGDSLWQTTIVTPFEFSPKDHEDSEIYQDKIVFSTRKRMFILNADNGTILWNYEDPNNYNGTKVIDGYIYIADELNNTTSTLHRFDINTGAKEELFTINRSEYGRNYSPGLLMPVKWNNTSGDEILIMQNRTYGWFTAGSDKMDILAWNLTADSMLWYRDSLDGSSSTARPAIDGDKVYFFGTWNAYCIDAGTGNTLWNYAIAPAAGGSFATANILIVKDKLIVKAEYDAMHAVDKETGERIWYNPDTEASPGLLTEYKDSIWFCSAGVFGIDANTGKKLIDDWNPGYGAWIFPVAQHPTNGNIYTSDASYLYCLNPKYMK